MAVLVTGGAGYIGSHMVLELLEAGEKVVVLDDLSTGRRDAVPAEATFVRGKVGDAPRVKALIERHGVEEVMHFAAAIVVPESHSNPLKYYLNNTAETARLFQTAAEAGVKRVIFSSTAAVYGQAAAGSEGEALSETTPLGPISPYGASKMMSERILADAAAAYGFSYAILRYFNVAGADPYGRAGQSSPVATHLIKIAAECAVGARDGMKIFGEDYATRDGTCERDYVHVSDLATAHLRALHHLRARGESDVFNVGYGQGATVREVIDAVRAVADRPFEATPAERRAGDPDRLVADAAKLRDKLGWSPRHADLGTIVKHALAWERRLHASRAA